MNQIIIYEDEFSDSHTFKDYVSMGLGRSDEEKLVIEWKTEEEILMELAIKFERMDSEQIFCWIQDTLRSKSNGDI